MPQKLLIIIEDDHDQAELLKKIASTTGNYATEIYLDGPEAIERILLDPVPSIVFISLYLPHTGGEAVLKAARASSKWKNTLIYFITSNDIYYHRHINDKGGADGILFVDSDLWDNVTELLKEHAKK